MEEELTSQIIDKKAYKTEIARKYTTFLSQYPEIFSDLIFGSDFDFALYDSLESYIKESPVDIFNVYRNGNGIEIKPGCAVDSDLELALSIDAIEKLIQTKTKEEYAKLLGSFYNNPDEKKGWIDFVLHKRTQTLINMGYGRFAKTAGILEDDDDK
ncbi:MAG: hypothetical protein CEE43_12860 [Promethearchaeota archaeon Loki_b32]|nr:MAG: hypothetical protein CEE43_12860 [Candidatus Lokiarchaeota archaeon Loki_b32]